MLMYVIAQCISESEWRALWDELVGEANVTTNLQIGDCMAHVQCSDFL